MESWSAIQSSLKITVIRFEVFKFFQFNSLMSRSIIILSKLIQRIMYIHFSMYRVPPDVKSEKMKEWWSKAHELLIETGMKRNDIVKAVEECDVRMRDNAVELIEFCRDNSVPFLLFSAGLGDVLAVCLNVMSDV